MQEILDAIENFNVDPTELIKKLIDQKINTNEELIDILDYVNNKAEEINPDEEDI